MERLPISLRMDSRTMEIMDRLCEQNDMERTTFMQFAIMGMLDYMSELGMMPDAGADAGECGLADW